MAGSKKHLFEPDKLNAQRMSNNSSVAALNLPVLTLKKNVSVANSSRDLLMDNKKFRDSPYNMMKSNAQLSTSNHQSSSVTLQKMNLNK